MEKIIIEKDENNHYKITQGDKYSLELGYDEMLGLFVSLTLPEKRPCLQWMKTEEEHQRQREYFESLKNENVNEGIMKVDFEDDET